MRTTMTLDPDVAAQLELLMRKRRQSMKAVVNEALRAGLAHLEVAALPRTAFRTTRVDLGPSLVGSVDDVEGVLARIEGEAHR